MRQPICCWLPMHSLALKTRETNIGALLARLTSGDSSTAYSALHMNKPAALKTRCKVDTDGWQQRQRTHKTSTSSGTSRHPPVKAVADGAAAAHQLQHQCQHLQSGDTA
jgi:hypothetical protein